MRSDARHHGRDGRHSGAGAGGAVGSRESPTDSLAGGNGEAGRQLEAGQRGTSMWAGGCQRPWLRAPNRGGGRLDVPPAGKFRYHGGCGTRPARSKGTPRNWTPSVCVVWPGRHRRQCPPRPHPSPLPSLRHSRTPSPTANWPRRQQSIKDDRPLALRCPTASQRWAQRPVWRSATRVTGARWGQRPPAASRRGCGIRGLTAARRGTPWTRLRGSRPPRWPSARGAVALLPRE